MKRVVFLLMALACALLLACSVPPATLSVEIPSSPAPLQQALIEVGSVQPDVAPSQTLVPATAGEANVSVPLLLIASLQDENAPQESSSPLVIEAHILEQSTLEDLALTETETGFLYAALEQNGTPFDMVSSLCVTYQSSQLLSCVVEFLPAGDNNSRILWPMTIELTNGSMLQISTFFSSTDTAWRGLLPEIVAQTADAAGVTLLCDVPTIKDSQPYYIYEGEIALLYRPYEIATYEVGWPCFLLPNTRIASYLTGAYGIGGTTP